MYLAGAVEVASELSQNVQQDCVVVARDCVVGMAPGNGVHPFLVLVQEMAHVAHVEGVIAVLQHKMSVVAASVT